MEAKGAEQGHRCLVHLSVQLYPTLNRRQGRYVVRSLFPGGQDLVRWKARVDCEE